MSNYYVSTVCAPLPSSSNYSSWAYVSYSVDPADASGVVSTQGHLVKNTIQARSHYAKYIDSHNLRSGWGGTYTWRSGDMNVNEGPTADNCAFYVKYNGQWINLRDNTAVEQAGLNSIFELQSAGYYVTLRTWPYGGDSEDKDNFGYTVRIKENSTLTRENFGDSTNEAVIIEFLADINSEDTGAYEDTTLGATSPLLIIDGGMKAVEEIWEIGEKMRQTEGGKWETITGALVPRSWNYGNYTDTDAQDTQINFPRVKRTLTNTPWLSKSLVGKRIDRYFSDSANAGTSEVYALKKGCLIGSHPYDERLPQEGKDLYRSAVVFRNDDGTYGIETSEAGIVGDSIQTILSKLKNNPTLYDKYRFHGEDAFVMLDVIGGGGGGGAAYALGNDYNEFAGGGGGGAGGSCRLAVRLTEGDLLFIEAAQGGQGAQGGQAAQSGGNSRVCLLNSNNVVISGVVCQGGKPGISATNNEGHFGGGNGGTVNWCYGDGYSPGVTITGHNGGNQANIVVWDSSVDQASQVGLVDNANRIYVIFAATGGWGGQGGDHKLNEKNDLYAQLGWQPQYNRQPFGEFSMITNASTQIFFECKSVGSSGENYQQCAGGCGGYAINKWESSAGGEGGRGTSAALARGFSGINGGGGGGEAAFYSTDTTPGAGGAGVIYVCR